MAGKIISIEIKGLKELEDAFKKAPKASIPIMDKAIKKSIIELRAATIPFTPVDLGFLRGGSANQTTFGMLTGELKNVAEYALPVHEGARGRAGRPFYDQGLAQAQPTIDKNFDKGLEEILLLLAK